MVIGDEEWDESFQLTSQYNAECLAKSNRSHFIAQVFDYFYTRRLCYNVGRSSGQLPELIFTPNE